MPIEINAQSRVKILDAPVAAPGTCILCGTAGIDDRKFVDFGKTVDWIGVIYFCSECIGEVSRALGWVPVAEYDKLLELHKRIDNVHDGLVKEHKRLTDALGTIFRSVGADDLSIDKFVRSLEANDSESEFSQGLDKEFDVGESETNKPDSVEGPDDLFDDTDFGD